MKLFKTEMVITFTILIGVLFLSGMIHFFNDDSLSIPIFLGSIVYAVDEPDDPVRDVSNETLAEYFILGDKLFNKADYDGALNQYERILQLDPFNANASYNIGNTLAMLGNYSDAVIFYDEALKTGARDSVAYNKGIALMKLNKPDEAVESYKTALSIAPNNTKALNNIGVFYGNSGEYAEAVKWYDKALQINPHYTLAMSNKGIVLMKLGNYAEALNIYNRQLEQMEDSKDIRIIPKKALVLGVYLHDYDQAVRLIEEFIPSYPKDRDLLCSTIEVYKAAGYEGTANTYQEILHEINPSYNCKLLTLQQSDIWEEVFV